MAGHGHWGWQVMDTGDGRSWTLVMAGHGHCGCQVMDTGDGR